MVHRSFEVTRLSGAIGAELTGIDLAHDLTNRQVDEIHEAFLENLVVFFRDQALTPDRLVALARHFGKPLVFHFARGMAEAPEVTEIVKEPDQQKSFGDMWHSDSCYLPRPPIAIMISIVTMKLKPYTSGPT